MTLRPVFTAVVLGVLLALVAVPSAGSKRLKKNYCCFLISVDVEESMKLDYKGTTPGAFIGSYENLWEWKTRTVEEWQNGKLGNGEGGLASALFFETSSVYVIRDAAGNHDIVECVHPYFSTSGLQGTRNKQLLDTAGSAQGFKPALILHYPNSEDFKPTCATAIEGPASHGLQDPARLTLRGPTRKEALKDFSEVCYQSIDVDDPNPFPHHFSGTVFYELRVDHFPKRAERVVNENLQEQIGRNPRDPQALNELRGSVDKATKAGTLVSDDKIHCR